MSFNPSKGQPEIKEKILNVLSKDSPKTCKEVAQETGIKTETVSYYLRDILKGQVIGRKSQKLGVFCYVLRE